MAYKPQILGKRFFRTSQVNNSSHPYLLRVVDDRNDICNKYYYSTDDTESIGTIYKDDLFKNYNSILPNYCINLLIGNSIIEVMDKRGDRQRITKPSVSVYIDQISPRSHIDGRRYNMDTGLGKKVCFVLDNEPYILEVRDIITDSHNSVLIQPYISQYNENHLCTIYKNVGEEAFHFRVYGYIDSDPVELIRSLWKDKIVSDGDIEYMSENTLNSVCYKIERYINNLFNIKTVGIGYYNCTEDLKQVSSFLAHFKRFDQDKFINQYVRMTYDEKISSVESLIYYLIDPPPSASKYKLTSCLFIRYNSFVNLVELMENIDKFKMDVVFIKFGKDVLIMVYEIEKIIDQPIHKDDLNRKLFKEVLLDNDALTYEEASLLFAHKHN